MKEEIMEKLAIACCYIQRCAYAGDLMWAQEWLDHANKRLEELIELEDV